jgi:hypothetical protein
MLGKGFMREYGRYLWDVGAWVFTVGGAIAALLLANDHFWYSILIFASITLSCLLFAFSRHRKLDKAQEAHQAERQRLLAEKDTAVQRLQDAERRLNEVPLDILTKIQTLVATSAYRVIADLLKRHAEIIVRMRSFDDALQKKPLNLRRFTNQADILHVIAKGAGEALQHLREGDAFLLVRIGADGLATDAAVLTVSQQPDLKREVAYFAIARYITDEMGHIKALAAVHDIEGIKGYTIRLPFDVARYDGLDIAHFTTVIDRFMVDIDKPGV